MRVGSGQARRQEAASRWTRLRRLPRPILLAALLLLLSTLAPVAAELAACGERLTQAGHGSALEALRRLAWAAPLLAAPAALLLLERPRTRSIRAYARQLHERLEALQGLLDGAIRRRPGEEEEEVHGPEPEPSEP